MHMEENNAPKSEAQETPAESSKPPFEEQAEEPKAPESSASKPVTAEETWGEELLSGPSLGIRLLRWFLFALILFGLGVAFTLWTIYSPQRKQLTAAQDQVQSLQQQVGDLQNQVKTLTPLDENNKNLQQQIDQQTLHTYILSARTAVAQAQLALAKQDAAKASLALSKTDQTLTMVGNLLPANQQKLVQDMQSRLKLAKSEIDNNAYAAQSDLDVLANSLVDLENSLFTTP
jgi:polyhydroxyalkanoate synthesis regulator phasin